MVQLQAAVKSGEYRAGEKPPAETELFEGLGISKGTIKAAYHQLELPPFEYLLEKSSLIYLRERVQYCWRHKAGLAKWQGLLYGDERYHLLSDSA